MGRSVIKCFFIASVLLFGVTANAQAWDREDARNYAEDYAINYNQNYVYTSGGDCANFVSQAIHHGGIAMDADWYYDFAYEKC